MGNGVSAVVARAIDMQGHEAGQGSVGSGLPQCNWLGLSIRAGA